jgi:hypothetical protein
MKQVRRTSISIERCGLLLTLALVSSIFGFSQPPGGPDHVTVLGTTVPANGDVNPYGVALVPRTIGKLVEGNFLVSNFNDAGNSQGTGTTIVQMRPNGSQKLFAQIDPNDPAVAGCTAGGTGGVPLTIGLTTALVALQSGFVVVGSLPTSDGSAATAQAGCLIVLDSQGNVAETIGNTVETIKDTNINGPWDMTAVDNGGTFFLFVTNVLNDTVKANGAIVNEGTVVRLLFTVPTSGAPQLTKEAVIANTLPERTDPMALVIGPTGAAFDPQTGNLLVADSLDSTIVKIPSALTAGLTSPITFSADPALNDPLGISLFGRDLFVANGNDGNIVEIDVDSGQTAANLVDNAGGTGAGSLFGLWAISDKKVFFVDDATNTFNRLH